MTLAEAEALDAADPLAGWRDKFVRPQGIIYLDGNSLGPLPKATLAATSDLVTRQWGERLIRSWNEGWIDAPQRVGNMDERNFAAGFGKAESFTHKFEKVAANPDAANTGEIVSVPLEALTPNPRADFNGNFIAFLNRADRPEAVDFEVDDDTVVDVAILVLCQRPQVERGTTFTEFRSKIAGPDVSFLSCFLDKTQAPCNPFEGDQLCTASLPMACYKPGKRVPPGLDTAGLGEGYSPGGEVRATPPVAASSFAMRADADKYCSGQFGAGWQILEYHVGAGGAIATYSDIAPKSRLWVDVSDQRYANCWDRDKPR